MASHPTRAARALGTALTAAVIALPLAAQNTDSLAATNQRIFAPLRLPEATQVRLGSGAPGPEYWQQHVDYRIRATLDPDAHRVTGSEVVTYTNHSPDTLSALWFQLDQNLFAPQSRGALVNAANRWRGSFADGGDHLTRVEVVQDGQRYTPERLVNDTRMKVTLTQPLPPGGHLDVEVDWNFVVPEYGADRMGRFHAEKGWIYEVAQWYPRVYVYDDVDGWNPMPYIGQGEFYLEYGNFDVTITAPRNLIVVGGGELQNPDEVLTATERQRLERARTSTQTVSIISRGEAGTGATRPSGNGPLTWHFALHNARDFTWAASAAFIWDAAGWDGTLLQSVYPAEGIGTPDNPGWEQSTQFLRHTISYYSTQWFRFPYPVATNVAGVVGGMEYPGIVFCSVRSRGQGLFGVTDHEFGHTWFPMVVGSDERRYAWMDEGFNTFINHYSNIDFYGDSAQRSARTSAQYIAGRMQEPIADQPIMTWPDMIRPEGLGFLAYRKPGYGLVLLREEILGPDRFDAAFRHYIAEWAFKHPKPRDFFRAMEESSGENLDWFWREWFYGTGTLDQAVDSVAMNADHHPAVYLSNRSQLVMPVSLAIEYADGHVVHQKLPVEIWYLSDDFMLPLDSDAMPVRVTVDPESMMPDMNRTNNTWQSMAHTQD